MPLDTRGAQPYNAGVTDNEPGHIGLHLKRQRVSVPLTLTELAAQTGISPSHLGRIERGERFPSARVLRKLARPLGFEEDELFTLAGYLSPQLPGIAEKDGEYIARQLDPMVARMLSHETPETQRQVLNILSIMKSLAKGMGASDRGNRQA